MAEQAREGRVDALEVAVEPGDAEQVVGQLEDAIGVALGPLAPPLQPGERRHRVVDAAHQLGPSALQSGGVGAMVEPVGLDRRVHRADLLGEAIGRDVQVAERRRDVPDLIAARVGDAGRQLPGRQSPGCLGDLSQRPRDRPPQHEAQAGDEQEHAKRHSSLGAGAGPCRTEIRRRRRRQLTGGLALQATQRADARPRHGQPPLRRHSPGETRRIPDHQLPHTLDRRVRRPGQQPVKLGDE